MSFFVTDPKTFMVQWCNKYKHCKNKKGIPNEMVSVNHSLMVRIHTVIHSTLIWSASYICFMTEALWMPLSVWPKVNNHFIFAETFNCKSSDISVGCWSTVSWSTLALAEVSFSSFCCMASAVIAGNVTERF